MKIVKDHRRPEVYPILPDSDGANDYSPHPDGRPWRKACRECAFRTSDPQDLGFYWQEELRHSKEGTVFYCVHRQDDAHERICACFAACRAGRPSPTSPEAQEDRSDG